MDSIPQKHCTKCNEIKSINEFSPAHHTKDKHTSWCRDCMNAHGRARYIPHPKPEYHPPAFKKCTGCHEIKPLEEFAKEPSKASGRGAKCKPCKRILDSRRYHARPSEQQRTRNKNLKRNFGITLDDYNRMHVSQNGLCAICGNPETSFDARHKVVRSLAVDHDHETGEVRGLLCYTCNMALGFLQEDPIRIQSLLAYILKYKGA